MRRWKIVGALGVIQISLSQRRAICILFSFYCFIFSCSRKSRRYHLTQATIKQHAKMECCFARQRDTHITEPAKRYVYPLFLCSLAEGISSISSNTTSNTTRVKTGVKQHAKMENCGARRGDTHITEPAQGYVYSLFSFGLFELSLAE